MTLPPPPLVGIELCRLIANGIAPCKLLNTLVPNSVPDGDLMFIVTDDTDRRENLVSALCVRVIACLLDICVTGGGRCARLYLTPYHDSNCAWTLPRRSAVT
jgi:hypothetical protein